MTLVADTVRTSQEAKTLLYLLPSEAETVIVQTKPSLAISVLLPPVKREINVSYFKDSNVITAELECPHIIWTQLFVRWKRPCRDSFCQCLKCNTSLLSEVKNREYKGQDNPYRFYMHTPILEKCTETVLHAADYSVANCDDGYVCWGGLNYPPSLRQANIFFWLSHLNNSPGRYQFNTGGDREEVNHRLAECMQNYKPLENRYRNRAEFIFGKQFFATSEKTQAVLLSFDEGLLSKFEEEAVSSEAENAAKAVIGFANRNSEAGGWHVDLNGKSFTLLDEDVIIR